MKNRGKPNQRRSNTRRSKPEDRKEEYQNNNRRTNSPRGENDISWYSRNPNLLVAAGSFPYPYRPGMQLPLGSYLKEGSTTNPLKANLQIPGVMVLDWVPNLGISNNATDPASLTAKEIYGRVRSVFSGSLNADAPDFVMYLMALDSVFSYIAWLKRLYRVMNVWTPENYILPDGVMQALNITQQESVILRSNRTRLWQDINELVLQTRKFMCPAVMDIFNRHYWMNDNLYTDSSMINSQFYLFSAAGYYRYKDTPIPNNPSVTASGLEVVSAPYMSKDSTWSQGDPVQSLYNYGLAMINALVAWDDAYEINGYLKAAYKDAPQFIVAELSADERLEPLYVEEVLAQIENSRALPALGAAVDYSGLAVAQDPTTNAVIVNPFIDVNVNFDFGNAISAKIDVNPTLSVRSMTPTVADSVIASRLQAMYSLTSGATTGNQRLSIDAGTEIPLRWRLISGGTVFQLQNQAVLPFYVNYQNDDPIDIYATMALNVEQFDWHPFIFIVNSNKSVSGQEYVFMLGDTNNITVISKDDLANLHRICIYSVDRKSVV